MEVFLGGLREERYYSLGEVLSELGFERVSKCVSNGLFPVKKGDWYNKENGSVVRRNRSLIYPVSIHAKGRLGKKGKNKDLCRIVKTHLKAKRIVRGFYGS